VAPPHAREKIMGSGPKPQLVPCYAHNSIRGLTTLLRVRPFLASNALFVQDKKKMVAWVGMEISCAAVA